MVQIPTSEEFNLLLLESSDLEAKSSFVVDLEDRIKYLSLRYIARKKKSLKTYGLHLLGGPKL
ncbi:MAG TPA: hypothetical protein VLD84_08010 [Nitrososphaeraceae archaeon]|nr:hypothetical protein [Nitrososphaeraceae archaeon]